MLSKKQKGILLALLSCIPLGTTPVFNKRILGFVNPEMGIFLWFMFQSGGFISFSLIFKETKTYKVLFKNSKKMFFFGLITFMAALTWCYGVLYDGPIITAFLLRFTDIFTVLFGFMILAERPSKAETLGILLALSGALLIGYRGSTQVGLLPLLSAIFYAIDALLVKMYIKEIDYFSLVGGRSIYTSLILFIYTFFSGKIQIAFPKMVFLDTFLGAVFGSFLGYLLFYKSLSLIDLTIATSFKTFNPFVTVLFSFILLGDQPTIIQMVGGGLITLGTLLIGFVSEKEKCDMKSAT